MKRLRCTDGRCMAVTAADGRREMERSMLLATRDSCRCNCNSCIVPALKFRGIAGRSSIPFAFEFCSGVTMTMCCDVGGTNNCISRPSVFLSFAIPIDSIYFYFWNYVYFFSFADLLLRLHLNNGKIEIFDTFPLEIVLSVARLFWSLHLFVVFIFNRIFSSWKSEPSSASPNPSRSEHKLNLVDGLSHLFFPCVL